MHTLENERLVVQVSDETGSIAISDKVAGVSWAQSTDLVMLRAGEPRLLKRQMCVKGIERIAGGLRVSAELPDIGGSAIGLTFDLCLLDNSVTIHLHEILGLGSGQMLDLAWPEGLVSGASSDDGYLVLPIGPGKLLKFGQETMPDVHEAMIYGRLKMALFGAIKGRGAVAAIVRTPYDCLLRTEANIGGHFGVGPVWIIEEGRLNYARELTLVFLADASYVEISKAYRQEMFAQNRFVSLRDKAKTSPFIDPLIGAVTGERHSYSVEPEGEPDRPNIRTFFDQAKELGFDRACIWFCGGDWNTEDMQREVAYAQSQSPGFRLSAYNNLTDISPTSPEYDERDIVRLRDGSLRPNWFTNVTVCAARRLERAKRRMPQVLDALGPGNVYIDLEGAMQLMECFSEEHPMTREQDAGHRRELLRYVKGLFGSVTTEHLPHDFLCDIVDIGAYASIYPYTVFDARTRFSDLCDVDGRDWYVWSRCPFKVIPIPLFQLVWHDSVLSMNSSMWSAEASSFCPCNWPCEPMHLPLYGLLPDDLSQRSLMMSRAMRASYYEELVEHRFLTGPEMEYTDRGLYRTRDVQMSRFGDGTIVVANFSDEPFFYDSHTPVPIHEFAIIRPGRATIIA